VFDRDPTPMTLHTSESVGSSFHITRARHSSNPFFRLPCRQSDFWYVSPIRKPSISYIVGSAVRFHQAPSPVSPCIIAALRPVCPQGYPPSSASAPPLYRKYDGSGVAWPLIFFPYHVEKRNPTQTITAGALLITLPSHQECSAQ
jgi:hypothetical protein